MFRDLGFNEGVAYRVWGAHGEHEDGPKFCVFEPFSARGKYSISQNRTLTIKTSLLASCLVTGKPRGDIWKPQTGSHIHNPGNVP